MHEKIYFLYEKHIIHYALRHACQVSASINHILSFPYLLISHKLKGKRIRILSKMGPKKAGTPPSDLQDKWRKCNESIKNPPLLREEK